MKEKYSKELKGSFITPLQHATRTRTAIRPRDVTVGVELISEIQVNIAKKSITESRFLVCEAIKELLGIEQMVYAKMKDVVSVFLDPRFLRHFKEKERSLVVELTWVLMDYLKAQRALEKEFSSSGPSLSVLTRLYFGEYIFASATLALNISKFRAFDALLEQDENRQKIASSIRVFDDGNKDDRAGIAGFFAESMADRVDAFYTIYENSKQSNLADALLLQTLLSLAQIERFSFSANQPMARTEEEEPGSPNHIRSALCQKKSFNIMKLMVKKIDGNKVNMLYFLKEISVLIESSALLSSNRVDSIATVSAFIEKEIHNSNSILTEKELRALTDAQSKKSVAEILTPAINRALRGLKELFENFALEEDIRRCRAIEMCNEASELEFYDAYEEDELEDENDRFALKLPDEQFMGPNLPNKKLSHDAERSSKDNQRIVIRSLLFAAPTLLLAAIPFAGVFISIAAFSIVATATLPAHIAAEGLLGDLLEIRGAPKRNAKMGTALDGSSMASQNRFSFAAHPKQFAGGDFEDTAQAKQCKF